MRKYLNRNLIVFLSLFLFTFLVCLLNFEKYELTFELTTDDYLNQLTEGSIIDYVLGTSNFTFSLLYKLILFVFSILGNSKVFLQIVYLIVCLSIYSLIFVLFFRNKSIWVFVLVFIFFLGICNFHIIYSMEIMLSIMSFLLIVVMDKKVSFRFKYLVFLVMSLIIGISVFSFIMLFCLLLLKIRRREYRYCLDLSITIIMFIAVFWRQLISLSLSVDDFNFFLKLISLTNIVTLLSPQAQEIIYIMPIIILFGLLISSAVIIRKGHLNLLSEETREKEIILYSLFFMCVFQVFAPFIFEMDLFFDEQAYAYLFIPFLFFTLFTGSIWKSELFAIMRMKGRENKSVKIVVFLLFMLLIIPFITARDEERYKEEAKYVHDYYLLDITYDFHYLKDDYVADAEKIIKSTGTRYYESEYFNHSELRDHEVKYIKGFFDDGWASNVAVFSYISSEKVVYLEFYVPDSFGEKQITIYSNGETIYNELGKGHVEMTLDLSAECSIITIETSVTKSEPDVRELGLYIMEIR